MKHQNKMRTLPTQHRVVNKTSIYRIPQEQKVTKDFTGWIGEVTVADNKQAQTTISIQSSVEIEAKHGRMFHFALSIARGNTNLEASVGVDEILEELSISCRVENRRKIAKLLKECMGVTVTMESGTYLSVFHLLDSAKHDSETGRVHFRVSPEFMDQLPRNKERFIDVSRVMRLRENNPIGMELATYLQTRGQGVKSRSGEPMPTSLVNHKDAVEYLHMTNLSEDDQIRTLRQAFKSLGRQGYPKYKMQRMKRGIMWFTSKLDYKEPKYEVVE